jgi:hypothetical protein
VTAFTGCWFDEEWGERVASPALVEISNETSERLAIEQLYSTPGATATFLQVETEVIEPGEVATLRMSEAEYEDMRAGRFVMEGRCGSLVGWRREGRHLPRRASVRVMHLRIRVPACAPPRLPADAPEPTLEPGEPPPPE